MLFVTFLWYNIKLDTILKKLVLKMFGRKIKHLLEQRDMSQADLVKATSLSKNLISGLVTDTLTNTSTDTILKIAKALRVSPAYFFIEHAYTPLEALELPDHIKEFVLQLDNMDYLVLAEDWGKKKIPPDVIKKVVSAYEEVIYNNAKKL
ncbi:MAG: helix-turn-helix domain-containing protein [Thermincolia bacterium]